MIVVAPKKGIIYKTSTICNTSFMFSDIEPIIAVMSVWVEQIEMCAMFQLP